MCVILIAEEKRIPEWMVHKAAEINNDGCGIAWREKGHVHWEKGLKPVDIVKLVKELPLPYVAHFRLASHGMAKDIELTHPFPVEPIEKGGFPAILDLSGKTRGGVLFHNGTFKEWKAWVLDSVPRFTTPEHPVRLQAGSWSDTRGLAWLAEHYGTGIIDIFGEKGVYFSPTDIEMFWGTGWVTIDGITASNSTFHTTTRAYVTPPACKKEGCFRRDTNHTGFCKEHRPDGPVCKSPNCDKTDVKDDGYCSFHQISHFPPRQPLADHPKGEVKELPPAKQLAAGAGGDRPSSGPFRLTSLEMAERFFTAHWISRSQVKKARKRFEEQKNQKNPKPVTVLVL